MQKLKKYKSHMLTGAQGSGTVFFFYLKTSVSACE